MISVQAVVLQLLNLYDGVLTVWQLHGCLNLRQLITSLKRTGPFGAGPLRCRTCKLLHSLPDVLEDLDRRTVSLIPDGEANHIHAGIYQRAATTAAEAAATAGNKRHSGPSAAASTAAAEAELASERVRQDLLNVYRLQPGLNRWVTGFSK